MSGGAVSRPRVFAQAASDSRPSAAPGIPLQMGGGRLPDGGQGANNTIKMKSIFEGNGSNANLKPVKMSSGRPQGSERALVFARASMGQEDAPKAPAAPPAPPAPPTNLNEVLAREGGPEGLTRREAADISAALQAGIEASTQALTAGQTCVGVDDGSISSAREIQTGMQRFSMVGNSDERLELRPSEIDLIEKVIECGETYRKLEAASKGRTMAFVAGGLIIGAVVLLVTT